jgi:predicted acylesterase/phospholipase RssA
LLSCTLAGTNPSVTQPAPIARPDHSRANIGIGEEERRDGRFIGLAISGGGSRAAVFGAAVMKELDRLGLLQQVDVISAVSGGALPAAYYTLDGYRSVDFSNGVMERMGHDFQRQLFGRWLFPGNLLRYWFTDATRSDTLVEVLDEELFHGATYADLNPARPKLLLNATNALNGEPFVISDESFAALNRPLASFAIARAVYMSAAYPGLFEPVVLAKWGEGDSPPGRPSVVAYDGGPVDNLGVKTLLNVLNEAAAHEPLERQFPNGCLVISVDATPRLARGDVEPLSAAAVLLKSNRRQVLEQVGIAARDQDRAMFGSFTVGQESRSSRCSFWHLALRQLPDSDPLGASVTRIKTNLGIEKEDQDALVIAAGKLIERGRTEGTPLRTLLRDRTHLQVDAPGGLARSVE